MNLQGAMQAVLEVLREPSSNLTAAALLAAIVTLLLLAVVVALIAWALRPIPSSKQEKDSGSIPEKEPSSSAWREKTGSPAMSIAMGVTIAVLILVAIGIAYYRTSSAEYCVDLCHENIVTEQDEAWPHGPTPCTSCHEDRTVAGAIGAVVFRLAHPYIGSSDTPESTEVDSDRCLRCHPGIRSTVLVSQERALRMSHAEPIEAGMYCGECHSAGHEYPSQIARMPICIRCHDGETVDADCSVCHTGDPALSSRNRRLFATEVVLPAVEDCSGCHDQTSCDSCHGIRMPHTTEFIEGTHAMQAAFDKKPLCYRCHLETDCGACHGNWGAHGPNFKAEHKSIPRGTNCTSCHRGHTGSFCARCHGQGW